MTTRQKNCTDHCSTCGRHFHGLRAFDAHRRGRCLDPVEATGWRAMQPWTEAGRCDLMPGCWEDGRRVRWEEPVTIWHLAKVTQKHQEAPKAIQRLPVPKTILEVLT